MTTFNQLIQQYTSEVSHRDTSQPMQRQESSVRLNNALVAKILEDRIVEHCMKYNNEQSQDLMNDIQKDLQDVRLQIFGGA